MQMQGTIAAEIMQGTIISQEYVGTIMGRRRSEPLVMVPHGSYFQCQPVPPSTLPCETHLKCHFTEPLFYSLVCCTLTYMELVCVCVYLHMRLK